MFGPIGMQELIIIFVIALIVFGPRKELRNTLEDEIRVEETRREIMEPIESIGREAREAVERAAREATESLETEEAAPEASATSEAPQETKA
jgi:Sec-independent protein translocase protein TatA